MGKVQRRIEDYLDIIERTRPTSLKYGAMDVEKRAAQFAPFSAVVGHDRAVGEVARHTIEKKILDETEKEVIDRTLREIEHCLTKGEKVNVYLQYFEKDDRKEGGQYLEKRGWVKKINAQSQEIYIDTCVFLIDDVYRLEIEDCYDTLNYD